ncbi:ArsR/SmtB family transcription factor [Agromyces sp. ZXT2-3]|uniref:ArsR/SmtB family transcription factor n=1 Tax=Agromyces sp. ZXT2-3 TaxID=3461152 RepID=UPI004054A697
MPRDFTTIGRALSAPARSDIVNILMDGSSRPAGELASVAGVSASTASEHLAVLVEAGILVVQANGRRRLYRIADGGIAAALEQLGLLCPPTEDLTYYRARDARRLADARFCYDHLAGRLGVAVTESMSVAGWLGDDLALTAGGDAALAERGIDLAALRAGRRRLTRPCADWTERRPHRAGSLGAAVAARFLAQRWIERELPRTVRITRAGRIALTEEWRVPADALPSRR